MSLASIDKTAKTVDASEEIYILTNAFDKRTYNTTYKMYEELRHLWKIEAKCYHTYITMLTMPVELANMLYNDIFNIGMKAVHHAHV